MSLSPVNKKPEKSPRISFFCNAACFDSMGMVCGRGRYHRPNGCCAALKPHSCDVLSGRDQAKRDDGKLLRIKGEMA